MEDRADAMERDAHARSPAFRNVRPEVEQHRFHIRPGDVGSLFEDRFQHALVFAHQTMISVVDITSEG